jgi:hypothetical protein
LAGYRAGRVRAIFTLPDHLTWIHSGPLVYIQLFNTFSYAASPFSRLNRVSATFSGDGKRQSAVIPITDLALACHIAPQFGVLEENDTPLASQIDLLDVGRRFFYNPYYNYYSYLLAEHWRKRRAGG